MFINQFIYLFDCLLYIFLQFPFSNHSLEQISHSESNFSSFVFRSRNTIAPGTSNRIRENKNPPTITMQARVYTSAVALFAISLGSAVALPSQCVQGQNCHLPNCFCPTFKHPLFPDAKEIPQMVYFGFDDALASQVTAMAIAMRYPWK